VANGPETLVPDSVTITRVQVFRVREEWPEVVRVLLHRKFTGNILIHCSQGVVGAVHVQENQK
jgi:hypothetical protein